jgi:hypothetical protein
MVAKAVKIFDEDIDVGVVDNVFNIKFSEISLVVSTDIEATAEAEDTVELGSVTARRVRDHGYTIGAVAAAGFTYRESERLNSGGAGWFCWCEAIRSFLRSAISKTMIGLWGGHEDKHRLWPLGLSIPRSVAAGVRQPRKHNVMPTRWVRTQLL